MTGAIRIHYEPGTWTPGDPLFVRPTSNIAGNHVRQLIQLHEIPGYRGGEHVDEDTGRLVWVDNHRLNLEDETCSCADRTRWPAPLRHSAVSETDDLEYRLARYEERERELAS